MTEGGFDARLKLKILRSMIPDCKRFLVPSKIISDLNPHVLNEEQMVKIVETERRSRRDAVEMLMEAVLDKKEDGVIYFISALQEGRNDNDRFLNPLLGDTAGQETMDSSTLDVRNHTEVNKYFEFIIQCLEGDITRCFTEGELKELFHHLRNEKVIDDDDEQELLEMSASQRRTTLFRMLPQNTREWPLKFFRALNQVKSDLVLKCDPLGENPCLDKEATAFSNFATQQEREPYSVQTSPKRLCTSSNEETDVPMDVEEQLLIDSEEDLADFSDEEKEDADTEKTAKPQPLDLRSYQYELAAPALKGENTIICAPTGSGKTRVALYIVMKHLDGKPSGKVVFMARSVPLVSQQFKIFQKYLPGLRCYSLHGDQADHQDLHLMLDDMDILVMTPKILENHLNEKKLRSLSVFSMLIFDECHHTRKNEPYNCVMKCYLQLKKKGEKGLPQIVGLTASIGVEKASTVSAAQQSIIEIMANLDVKSITKVTDNLDELAMTVPTPDESMDQLTPRVNDEVSKSIYTNMVQVENLLNNQVEPMKMDDPEFEGVRSALVKRPATRNSQKYGQWAVKVRDQARKVNIPQHPSAQLKAETIDKRRLFSQNVQLLAETLIAYNEALDVHELSRPVDVLEHLKNKLNPRHSADSPAPTPIETKLENLFDDLQKKLHSEVTARNPNLAKLSEVIEEHLNGKWDSSRVMIFVRTRATCQALCSWLNMDDSVSPQLRELRASPFTGTGAHEEVGGMTQHQQEGVIDKFRDGDVKLLVCTTVGQEGMDIPDCNLVIRYNHISNEVATVQTRGRSRKAGGMSVLLAMPEVIRRERINKKREEIMNQAIDSVNQMRTRDVDNRVLKAQKQAMDKDEIKKIASLRLKSSKVKNANFTLECAKCRKVRVPGFKIRTINSSHHVIIGMDLKDSGEVSIKPKAKPKSVDKMDFTGEIICNKCPVMKQSDLGTVAKYQAVDFMALKAESWLVLNEKGEVEKCGRWKWRDIRYTIPELSPSDMNTHMGLPADYEEDEEDTGSAAGMS